MIPIIILIILAFFVGAVVALCLCKESINWRNEKCGYVLEDNIGEKKNKEH